MLNLSLTANGMLAAPGGYPIRMGAMSEPMASGMISGKYSSVSAIVSCDSVAMAHLALYMPPILSSATDLSLIAQTDMAIRSSKSTISVAVASTLPTVSTLPQGTIGLTAGSKTITQTGTSFATDGSWVGYQVHVDGDNDANGKPLWYTLSSSLQLTVNATNTVSGVWYLRPPAVNPVGYVVRLWFDGFVNRTPDTISRRPGTAGYAVAKNPGLPQGATVYSVQAS